MRGIERAHEKYLVVEIPVSGATYLLVVLKIQQEVLSILFFKLD